MCRGRFKFGQIHRPCNGSRLAQHAHEYFDLADPPHRSWGARQEKEDDVAVQEKQTHHPRVDRRALAGQRCSRLHWPPEQRLRMRNGGVGSRRNNAGGGGHSPGGGDITSSPSSPRAGGSSASKRLATRTLTDTLLAARGRRERGPDNRAQGRAQGRRGRAAARDPRQGPSQQPRRRSRCSSSTPSSAFRPRWT